MKRSMKIVIGIGSAMVLLSSALYAGPTDDPGIQKKEQNQQKRIDQGINSGQLTHKEAGKLEKEQTRIRQDEARMKSDGKLTNKERRKLDREQNKASKDIHKKKHNNKTAKASQ